MNNTNHFMSCRPVVMSGRLYRDGNEMTIRCSPMPALPQSKWSINPFEVITVQIYLLFDFIFPVSPSPSHTIT